MAAFDGRNPALMAELMAESPRGLIYRDSYMATDQKAGGSNPSWRARKAPKSLDFGAFLFVLHAFSGPAFLPDPRFDPHGDFSRFFSHRRCQETAHLVRRVLFHGRRDVAVGIQGEARAVMAEDAGEGFHVHTVLQGKH